MEQYTANSSSSTEQIVVQAGQIQQQQQGGVTAVQLQTEAQVASASGQQVQTLQVVQGQPLMVQVSGGQLITSTGQPIMVQAVPGGQGQTIMQVPVSGTQGLQQIQLVQPGQIQIQGGQAVQVQGQQGQTQQIIIQQPQTAVTAGQTQTQQQIAVQGQQVAQAAEGQTIVYQPVNADGTILQQDGAWGWLSPCHPEDPPAWSRDAGRGAPVRQCQAVPPHPEEEAGTGQAGSRGKNPQREKEIPARVAAPARHGQETGRGRTLLLPQGKGQPSHAGSISKQRRSNDTDDQGLLTPEGNSHPSCQPAQSAQ
uniref:Nuclear transcription factor Y subunit alpha n=1 Tax=Junco hyemalis TaxID=40217 RepID=A0A8C5NS38_JUNHY